MVHIVTAEVGSKSVPGTFGDSAVCWKGRGDAVEDAL